MRIDKVTSKKEKETNQPINIVGNMVTGKQDLISGAAMASTSNMIQPTPKIPQTKIDATDRRQVEAQNEDKSHTTKEELDDIKRTHYKEKKKKEHDNMAPCQSGIITPGRVINIDFVT